METVFDKFINFWKTGKSGKPIIIIASILLLPCICSSGNILLSKLKAPSPAVIGTAIAKTQAIWTPAPTQTSLPPIVVTVIVTKVVIPTFTSTPLYTPTITQTPTVTQTSTKTPTITPTDNPLTMIHYDGFYLVGIVIAPGLWRSQGSDNGCYWEIDTRTGDIINNHFGMAGGTMYISTTAFQVSMKDCGNWIYLGP